MDVTFEHALAPSSTLTRLPYLGKDRQGHPILLRIAGEADAKPWIEHLKRITTETPWMLQSEEDTLPTLEEQRSNLVDYYTRPGSVAICAVRPQRNDTTILGTITLASGRFRRTHHAAELSMGVGQAWWGLGIGSLLMSAVLQWAHDEGSLRRISLSVFSGNEQAFRLYQRVGFTEEGVHRRYVRVDGRYHDLVGMGYRVSLRTLEPKKDL